MNERLKYLRKNLGLTQTEFGQKIGLTTAAISDIERGKVKNITDRNIQQICREFCVDEHWFRTGEGKMFIEISKDEELAELTAEITMGNDEFIKEFIRDYMKLPEGHKQIIRNMLSKTIEQKE